MSFIPAAIKLTGPEVDPAKQAGYVTGVLGRLSLTNVTLAIDRSLGGDAQLVTRYETDPLMGGTGMNVNFVTLEPEAAHG